MRLILIISIFFQSTMGQAVDGASANKFNLKTSTVFRTYSSSKTFLDFIVKAQLPEQKEKELYRFASEKKILEAKLPLIKSVTEKENYFRANLPDGVVLEIRKENQKITFWLNHRNLKLGKDDSIETIYESVRKVMSEKNRAGVVDLLLPTKAYAVGNILIVVAGLAGIAAIIAASISLLTSADEENQESKGGQDASDIEARIKSEKLKQEENEKKKQKGDSSKSRSAS